jgi:hypothetical protein
MSHRVLSTAILAALIIAQQFSIPGGAGAQSPFGEPFVVNGEGDSQVHSAIAYNHAWQEFLVVWFNDRPGNDDVYAQRISRWGSLVGPRRVVAAGAGAERRYPDVAWSEAQNQYLVVWAEEEVGGISAIRGQRLTAEALPEGPVITVTGGTTGMLDSRYPAVAYALTSNRYLVVWELEVNLPPQPTSTSIIGQIVTGSGALEGTSLTIVSDPGGTPRRRPDVAYNVARNEHMVVWQHRIGPEDVIYGRRVRGNGELLFPELQPINSGSGGLEAPAIAALPNVAPDGQYLVTWNSVGGGVHIPGQRLAGNGTRVGNILGVGTFMNADANPAVAASEGRRRFLVAWTRSLGALDHRICTSLIAPLDPGGPDMSPSPAECLPGIQADHASAAGHPSGFLIAYDEQPLSATSRDLYAVSWGYRIYLPTVLR